jgi:hypothetical protein
VGSIPISSESDSVLPVSTRVELRPPAREDYDRPAGNDDRNRGPFEPADGFAESRPLMARSSALGYACAGMAAGATLNATFAASNNGWTPLRTMEAPQWAAALFLGVVPGATGFFLWVYAIQRTTPSRSDDHDQTDLRRSTRRTAGR